MKHYKWLIGAIGVGLLGGILAACGTDKNAPLNLITVDDMAVKTEDGRVELIALVDTEEEAQEIADLYEIELLSFSESVAVYATDQDPHELIALGQEKGYPLLSINQIQQLH